MPPHEELVVARSWHVVLIERYKDTWFDKHFRLSGPLSLALFLFSIFGVNVYAINFATEKASNPVTDIILSNTPVFNVSWFFVWGLLLMVLFIVVLCLLHPKRIPFTLHALTLFVVIRAIFVSLTHLAPFETHAVADYGTLVSKLFYGSDLFFSGHTGAPFLMALIYWHDHTLRYIFLALSAFFGAVVLLGHLHYTIDVLSAFFITYGIYHIALWLFPKDRLLFLSQTPSK